MNSAKLMCVPQKHVRRSVSQWAQCMYKLIVWYLVTGFRMFPLPWNRRDRRIFSHPIRWLRSRELKGIRLRRDYDDYNLVHYHPSIRFLTTDITFRREHGMCAMYRESGKWYEW